MRTWLVLLLSATALLAAGSPSPEPSRAARKVYVLPIRENIMPPLVYLVRRGVKEAIEARADALVLDMETNGGRVDTTEEIISVLEKFKGETVTYVNKKAFSAGMFIAVATRRIYMAPGSVIGAAAPIILSPGGDGVEKLSDTYEKKMTSAVRANVRKEAERNGHNIAVVEAMIDKTKGLTIDGVVIAKEGEILTLTNTEAEKEYGSPPKKLLSLGTVESLDALLNKLGYADAVRREIKPTGAETLGFWLNAIAPILLIIGIVGIYIEFKTPGFGLPGVAGITAFALYFLGGYVAGLSGAEWIVVFIVGLGLVAVEIFVYPGTLLLGLAGAGLMLLAIIMAVVDVYPNPGSILPAMPSLDKFQLPLRNILIAMAAVPVIVWILSRFLPQTSFYRSLVSQSASGVMSENVQALKRASLDGAVGTAISTLRPGGKAQFGDQILDVITQGDMVAKGTRVKIVGYSGPEAIVQAVQ